MKNIEYWKKIWNFYPERDWSQRALDGLFNVWEKTFTLNGDEVTIAWQVIHVTENMDEAMKMAGVRA